MTIGKMPLILMMTKKNELVVYDFQKEKVLNYLVSHSQEVELVKTRLLRCSWMRNRESTCIRWARTID